MALALLLTATAALAGKPVRTLPHPSASRSAGSELLARTGRRQTQRTVARLKKHSNLRSAAKAVRSRPAASKERTPTASKIQRRDSALAHTRTSSSSKTRSLTARQRRGSKRSARVLDAADDQPVHRRSRSSASTSRGAKQQARSDEDDNDPVVTVADRQAFSSTSPLKSIEQEAGTPVLLPNLRVASLYDNRGRLIVPAPLYGSREILLHQNEMADKDGLNRIRDNDGLEDLLRQKKLVALPASEALQVDDRLPGSRRYSRPWTAAFLSVLSRDFYASFHQPIYVTSAVRTMEVQQRLVRTNGNAAPVRGDSASPHLTGQAIDIAKKGLNMTQIAWLRTYLQPLIGDGKIDVEEEFRQACFHISVYRGYLPMAPRMSIAASREGNSDSRP